MPEGACVIEYRGKRGVTWKIKFVDAERRQVKVTLGRAADGWTRRKAERELRAKLVAVDRDGYRRPDPLTLSSFAATWLDEYPRA